MCQIGTLRVLLQNGTDGYALFYTSISHRPMINDFALELRVARKKAGFSQADCAHFLDVHQSEISRYESGARVPPLPTICRLSIIYGRSFETLFASMYHEGRRALRERLKSMPQSPARWLGNFNRDNSLRSLSHRLSDVTDDDV